MASNYKKTTAARVISRVSTGTLLEDMLDKRNLTIVLSWLYDDTDDPRILEFRVLYANARKKALVLESDRLLKIVDGCKDKDDAAIARVRLDARKFLLERLIPELFGNARNSLPTTNELADGLEKAAALIQKRREARQALTSVPS